MKREDEDSSEIVVEKKPRRRLAVILVASALIMGAGAAGGLLAPKLLSASPAPAPAQAKAAEADPIATDTYSFAPIVVDVRDEQGGVHHLKVGLSAELADGMKETDMKPIAPRGREAAIAYLRAQSFEGLTDPKRFEEISKLLSEKVVAAMGKQRVRRILVTDYVAQ